MLKLRAMQGMPRLGGLNSWAVEMTPSPLAERDAGDVRAGLPTIAGLGGR